MRGDKIINDLLGNGDIVEIRAHDGILWVSRNRFEEIQALSRIMEMAVALNADGPTISRIFDTPADFAEVLERFDEWKAERTANLASVTPFPTRKSEKP